MFLARRFWYRFWNRFWYRIVCYVDNEKRQDFKDYRCTDGKDIKFLQEEESYKYLGIIEVDKFLAMEMKLKVS